MIFTKQFRRANRSLFRMMAASNNERKTNYVFARCDENRNLREILDLHQVNGQIGVISCGMDCDCSSYHREYVREGFKTVMELRKYIDDYHDNLEGPGVIDFCRPDKIDRDNNRSRDLALEAFEEGHAHVVYYR